MFLITSSDSAWSELLFDFLKESMWFVLLLLPNGNNNGSWLKLKDGVCEVCAWLLGGLMLLGIECIEIGRSGVNELVMFKICCCCFWFDIMDDGDKIDDSDWVWDNLALLDLSDSCNINMYYILMSCFRSYWYVIFQSYFGFIVTYLIL